MKKIILITFLCFALTACNNEVKTNDTSISAEVKQIENISPLANDPAFKESIHIARNTWNDTSTAVKGDGTILVNSMRPENEYITILKDERTKEAKYISKTVNGEDKKTVTYGDYGESYSYSEPTIETTIYDKNGKDMGLKLNAYSANYVIGNKIFFNDESKDYDNNLYVFDVRTKEVEKSLRNRIAYYADHIILSTDPYVYNDNDKGKKDILICDDELNVIKTIEDYSFYNIGMFNGGEFEIAVVSQIYIKNPDKDLSDMRYGDDFEYRYNYLDENFNLIFEKPVMSHSSMEDSTVIKVHDGDIEYDYDLKKKEKVSEDRPYSGFDNYNDMVQAERNAYEEMNQKIASDPKYSYVDTRVYNGKVLYFAHKADNEYIAEEDIYLDHADVYNAIGELVLEVEQLNSVFDEDGYFFVNDNTVYDFDLNVVKTFDSDVYIQRNDKSRKSRVFFSDSVDKNFNSRDHYNVYDDKFNVVFENVVSMEFYTYDDYIVFATDDWTRIYDLDMNIVKEFDRSLAIHNYFDNQKYRTFVDMKTKREGIIDDKYNIVVDGLKSVSFLEDKCFSYMNGFKYGLMDYDGKVICSFSIFNNMEEDANKSDYDLGFVD